MTEDLTWLVTVILFIWSAALVWGTWQLRALAKELDAQERELWRWKRLVALHQSQKVKWQ